MALTSLSTAVKLATWQQQSRQSRPAPPPPAYHVMESETEAKAIPLSVIEETISVDSVDSFPDVENQPRSSNDCAMIRMLPPEIHLEILDHLEYPDIRAVKNVSLFFRRIITTKQLEKARQRWKVSLHDRELNNEFLSCTRIPCYTCIRIREISRFPSMPIKVAAQQPPLYQLAADRKCIDCTWKEVSAGHTVWVDETPWVNCKKCHRRRRVYRWKEERQADYLCARCGRLSMLRWRWPIWLFQAGEIVFPWLMLAWTVMLTRQGPLQSRPGQAGNSNQLAHLIYAVTTIQEFLSLLWLRSWCKDDYDAKRMLTFVLFWVAILGWPWVISSVGSLSNEGKDYRLLAVFIKCSFAFCIINAVCRLVSVMDDQRRKWRA